jgi:hypothetical protein
MARPKQLPIHNRDYPVYKFSELIAAVGTDKEIQALIVEYGFEPPSEWVIRGWRGRNSIPSRWLPILLMQAISIGAISDISSLVKGVQVKQKRNVRKPKALT